MNGKCIVTVLGDCWWVVVLVTVDLYHFWKKTKCHQIFTNVITGWSKQRSIQTSWYQWADFSMTKSFVTEKESLRRTRVAELQPKWKSPYSTPVYTWRLFKLMCYYLTHKNLQKTYQICYFCCIHLAMLWYYAIINKKVTKNLWFHILTTNQKPKIIDIYAIWWDFIT